MQQDAQPKWTDLFQKMQMQNQPRPQVGKDDEVSVYSIIRDAASCSSGSDCWTALVSEYSLLSICARSLHHLGDMSKNVVSQCDCQPYQ